MDLVNSVTQNSNNTKVPMENQSDEGNFNDDESNSNSNSNNNNNNNGNTKTLFSPAPSSIDMQMSIPRAPQAVAQKNQVPDYLKVIGMDPKKFWPKKYRFTREKSPGIYNPLTIAQRNFYETNGFIVIDDCVSQKLLENIRSQYKLSALVDEYLVDKLVAKNGKLLQYVKCFCDEHLMLMTHQLIESFQSQESAKAVMDNEQGQRQHLFRDWIYLPFRPIDKVVCAITAIEPLEHVLLVVPGTHRVGQCSISLTLGNISAAYDASQEKSQQLMARELFECSPEKLSSLVEKSKKGFKYINLKAGQTLFYHPGLVHGFSDDLINYRKRQLATIAYYAAADCEYIDLRKSPELLAQQPVPIGLAHFQDQNPSDYSTWINRPRLLTDLKAGM